MSVIQPEKGLPKMPASGMADMNNAMMLGLDLTLQLASATASVSVTAESTVALATASSYMGNIEDSKQVADLHSTAATSRS